MKNKWRLSGLAMLLMSTIVTAQGQINIVVDAGKPGAKINPNLYGVFFEEINHAGEGGLYGELIRNRDFEATKEPEGTTRVGDYIFSPQGWKHFYVKPKSLDGWRMETAGNARAQISQVIESPLNKNNPHSMKVEISNPSQDGIRIINDGFWGIAIREGETYNLSFYAHAANGFDGNVKVALLNEKGEIIDSKMISGIKGSWNKYQCSFIAKAGCKKGSFAVIPQSKGTLWLDVVSLFPEKTFKGRVNGTRNDVAQRIADIKPGFVRFPGGCIVEGVTLENRWQWKNTIGDIAQRPGRWMLWDYHSTEGMGFHEYLQFCEDLGCPAMYVFPVGMTCQFRNSKIVDVKALKPYIDDVLDALEYALGPVTSKWGALRAKNGHSKPFNIEYLEIGNENYGPVYQDHYNYFYKALKQKYPQLKMIACTDPGMRETFKRSDLPGITQPVEMIDEHFYESPDFFYKNSTRYDQYDRKG
ncbi:MAG: carbohydrate binding domain-containing protein, partial [Bacteroidota bacterium]|nr:carbohydrate binding domain-containing protein [Bacteroidota bacterium]